MNGAHLSLALQRPQPRHSLLGDAIGRPFNSMLTALDKLTAFNRGPNHEQDTDLAAAAKGHVSRHCEPVSSELPTLCPCQQIDLSKILNSSACSTSPAVCWQRPWHSLHRSPSGCAWRTRTGSTLLVVSPRSNPSVSRHLPTCYIAANHVAMIQYFA